MTLLAQCMLGDVMSTHQMQIAYIGAAPGVHVTYLPTTALCRPVSCPCWPFNVMMRAQISCMLFIYTAYKQCVLFLQVQDLGEFCNGTKSAGHEIEGGTTYL
jgi:hypothetical protein